MSNDKRIDFTTPKGRIVWGNLYTPQTKDADGKPLVIKNGTDAGKPRVAYNFGVAIPKVPGQHWATYPRDPKYPERMSFGEAAWSIGHSSMGTAAQSPGFAWKITDGDSAAPNKKGRKPCDQEGFPGHWVLSFSGSFAPKCYNGQVPLLEKDAIKPGYFVQVAGSASGNSSSQNPGIYLNHAMVSLQAIGPEIVSGPDATQAGFGEGVTMGAATTPPPPAGAPGAPMPPLPPGAGTATPPPPAPVPVTPNPAFVAAAAGIAPFPPPAQPAGAAPPPPPGAAMPAPPAPPARQMLPAAGNFTYEQMIAGGWTDATLRAAGMMA